jgi:hypothetical protein
MASCPRNKHKLIDEVVMTAAAWCSQRNAFPSSLPPGKLGAPSKCVLKGIEGIEKLCSDSLQQAAAAAMSVRPAPARTITPRHTAARAPTQILIVLPAPALAAPTTSLRSNLTETREHYAKSAGKKSSGRVKIDDRIARHHFTGDATPDTEKR